MKDNKFVIKMVEEECEDDYFVITAPSSLTKEDIKRDIEMAKKYIWVMDYSDEEMPEEFDEHFKEMFEYREDSNGGETFLHYFELRGYKVEALIVDFEVEW